MAKAWWLVGFAVAVFAGCNDAPSDPGAASQPAVEPVEEGIIRSLPTCSPEIQLADTDSTSCTVMPPMGGGPTGVDSPRGGRWTLNRGLLSRRDRSGQTTLLAQVRVPVALGLTSEGLVLAADDGRRWLVIGD